jgi:hypothetical protein
MIKKIVAIRDKIEAGQHIIDEAVDELEILIDELKPDTPISNFRCDISGSTITCRWNAHEAGEMDIEYYSPGNHSQWQHSVERYVAPINIEDEVIHIGIGNFDEWELRPVINGEAGETVTVKKT